MSTLARQRRWLERGTDALALVGFAGLVAICLVTMYDGLARYFWLPRVPGFRDFGEVIFAVLIACCFPIGLLRNQNIAIAFLGQGLAKGFGPGPTRWLNLFAALLTLIAFAVLAYAMIERSAGLGVRTTRTGFMVVAPWAWTATIILSLGVLIQAWVVVARIAEARGAPPLVDDRGGATEAGMEEALTGVDEIPDLDDAERTDRDPRR